VSKTCIPARTMSGNLKVIQNTYCTVRKQYRFPHSKKRRIRAKWAKRERNFRYTPSPYVYIMENHGIAMMHPATYQKLHAATAGQP